MDITIYPKKLSGTVTAIPSKSQAHRLLICAAFANTPTTLICPQTNEDIEATVGCLNTLGAGITRTEDGYRVNPVQALPESAVMDCRESGSTLRFLLPVVGALGVNTTFQLSGRLPSRPLSPLWEEMERMGCLLSRPTENTLRCTGRLTAGNYSISGNVSSQFITGLLFALALIPGDSHLEITGKIESKPYINMTKQALFVFGEHAPFRSPGTITVEGDWSNGAFFLAAKAMGNPICVQGLSPDSPQGDLACEKILKDMTDFVNIDASQIPDLVPILAVAASASKGGEFYNAGRLRLKESDRIESVAAMLRAFGAAVSTSADSITVKPAEFHSCTVDAAGDHRIAMAAAIGATVATGPVTILDAHCVSKSYPSFWEVYKELGGNYVEHIR